MTGQPNLTCTLMRLLRHAEGGVLAPTQEGNPSRNRHRAKQSRAREEADNSSRPSRLRGGFSAQSRLHAGVAVFMTACFIIGPEQVVAMHQEAIAYQMMAAAGIGQCPTGSATVSYCYDANGSLKERYEAGQLVATYTFDAENRLAHYAPTAGDAAAYTYDADGIRNSKTVGAAATWHLTDKNQPYAQVLTETDTATGDLQVRYVHGDDLISQHRPTEGISRYYHYDGQMSTRQLTDDATGTAVAIKDRYAYDAFGVGIREEGSSDNAYRYTGEQWDGATNMYYLRARYYEQQAGRFASTDPFPGLSTVPPSLHRYLYANCNPIAFRDPTGMMSYGETMLTITVASFLITVVANTLITMSVVGSLARDIMPSGVVFSLGIGYANYGFTIGATALFVIQFAPFDVDLLIAAEAGTAPMSGLKSGKHSGVGTLSAVGLAFNMNSINDLHGLGATATWPRVAGRWSRLLIEAFIPGKSTQRAMDFLSKYSQVMTSSFIKNKRPGVIQFSQGTSGASVISVGAWSYGIGTTVGYAGSAGDSLSEWISLARSAFSGASATSSPEDIAHRTDAVIRSAPQ